MGKAFHLPLQVGCFTLQLMKKGVLVLNGPPWVKEKSLEILFIGRGCGCVRGICYIKGFFDQLGKPYLAWKKKIVEEQEQFVHIFTLVAFARQLIVRAKCGNWKFDLQNCRNLRSVVTIRSSCQFVPFFFLHLYIFSQMYLW